MDCFSRHRRLVSGLTHEAVSRAIEMWCLHCSPCIFARPRGWAYKRLCPSVCPRFFFPAIQTSTSGGWRGLERWFGGRRSSPCIFFTIVFTWEWMRRQDFCLAHFGGCGVWMWKYVRFGGFSPVFLCWSNAHNIKEYVNTKKFVIVTIFWEKWCITWQKCRSDKTFDNGCILTNWKDNNTNNKETLTVLESLLRQGDC